MQAPPFNTYLGIRVERKQAGTASASLDLAAQHLNRRGVAHGGVVSALLDSALGAAVISAMPQEWWCATTSLSCQFIEGAGTGCLTATGSVLRRGRKIAFAAGEVRDDRNRLIATAQGTWHLWPHRPGVREASPPVGTVVLRETGESVRVGKIVAVGRNYAEHAAEMGTPGEPPVLFLKPASSLLRDVDAVPVPTSAGEVHHEVELVVVIGTPGKAIAVDRALEHVLGYAVGLDLTLRDVQTVAKERGEPWALAKGFDGASPISAVVGRDEVGDGSGLAILLDVNGRRRQDGNTDQMIRGVPEIVAHVSSWMTLERGDLLFTGTPAGVGPLQPGDRVDAQIDKVGRLSLVIEGAADGPTVG